MNFDALSHVMKTKYVIQVSNITMIPKQINLINMLNFSRLNVEVIIWAFDLPQLEQFFHFHEDLQGSEMSQN